MPVNFLWQAWHMKIYSNSCVRYLRIACISSGHCADVGVLCGAVLLRAHEHVVHGDSVLGRLVQSIDNHVGWREWITRTGGKPLEYSNRSQSFLTVTYSAAAMRTERGIGLYVAILW